MSKHAHTHGGGDVNEKEKEKKEQVAPLFPPLRFRDVNFFVLSPSHSLRTRSPPSRALTASMMRKRNFPRSIKLGLLATLTAILLFLVACVFPLRPFVCGSSQSAMKSFRCLLCDERVSPTRACNARAPLQGSD